MKIILATLVALASVNGSKIQHHEGTFYEEYNVGGHSHAATEGPHRDTEGLGLPPIQPSHPNLYATDNADIPDHRHVANVDLGLGNDDVTKLYNKQSSSSSSSSSKSTSSSSHNYSSNSQSNSDDYDYDHGYSDAEDNHDYYDDHNDNTEEEYLHVSPKPTITYSTST